MVASFYCPKKTKWTTINVFDLFCGPGKDGEGNYGSPLIILQELIPHAEEIKAKHLDVKVYFNDNNSQAILQLKNEILGMDIDVEAIKIHISDKDVFECFSYFSQKMDDPRSANYVFLDQFGIKFVTEKILRQIASFRQTDVLFFISSSFLVRFKSLPEIRKYLDVGESLSAEKDFANCHKAICEYYKTLVPENTGSYMAPFSIKKGSNVYGLIFSSSSLYGAEKFLRACWKADPVTGESNWLSEHDKIISTGQLTIDEQYAVPIKLLNFERDLKDKIIQKTIRTNREVYKYVIEKGFLPRHGKSVFKKLIKVGLLPSQKISISWDGQKTLTPIRYYDR